ncbi:unnamed protein product [Bursaphelenchus xylophilus]|uniref:(pine wood nematode) hypothetical protein n=1 Tax=Bursaphelenchus xylophilus TaxID=6326 RepID=A0A1I7SI93_BURXY|nr:unnamed protein product [Bursaphelenchus xylophilus]CAG9125067.1 unnamed protein product [Bursaphelenchus xylophilus]
MSTSNDWMELLKSNLQTLSANKNYGRFSKKLVPISAGEKEVKFELTVDDEEINGKGTLYGGQTASLVDLCTAMVMIQTVRDTPLVSVEISCSYLSPAFVGEKLIIEATILRSGRNMIFAEAVFSKENGTIVAKGKHTCARLNHLKVEGQIVIQ